MSDHLTGERLEQLRSGRLAPADVIAVAEHLERCAACRKSSASGDAAARLVAVLGEERDEVTEHPDPGSRLFPYADGTLDPALRREVEAHLAVCELCADDVADLRATPVRRRRPRRRWFVAVAAAAIAAAIVIVLELMPGQSAGPAPPQVPGTVAVDAAAVRWRRLADAAVTSGRVERPAILGALRPHGDVLRGSESRGSSLRAPVGVVVESARPRFSWWPAGGATFRVSVFEGERLVAQSPFVTGDSWACDRDLAPGRTYSWQVEVRRGSERTVLPPPSDGDALFRVLDDASARDVAAARARFPDDHLLAGVLYAHYGVQDRAAEELRAAANPAARRLLDDLGQAR